MKRSRNEKCAGRKELNEKWAEEKGRVVDECQLSVHDVRMWRQGEGVRLDRWDSSDTGEDEVCTLRVCGRGKGEQGRDGRKRVCTAAEIEERSAEEMTG